MLLASGQTVSERVPACIGHTVSQPNGLGQREGEPRQGEEGRSAVPRVEWHRPRRLQRTQPQSRRQIHESVFIYHTCMYITTHSKV